MNIIFKNLIRNAFGKPLRTILVVFSIFVCSISAMLCFDLSGALKSAMLSEIRSVSTADFQLILKPGQKIDLGEDFPEAEVFPIYLYNESYYVDIPGEYNYVKSQSVRILGMDFGQAARMEFIPAVEAGPMEAVVTTGYAGKTGCAEGDTVTLHDKAGDPHEFTVVKILSNDDRNALISEDTILVDLKSAEVLSCGQDSVGILMIDVKDNNLASDAKTILADRYGEENVDDLMIPEEILRMTENLTSVMAMVFVITFLLVIFVTFSICERIVSERMSLVGTLRSLGMSTRRTAGILLLENIFYALMGSVPAVVVYALIRVPLLTAALTTDQGDMTFPDLSVILVTSVIAGAVIIECLIPLRAILKAMKISIRDIIFDNRDTEYKLNRTVTVIGIILVVLAAVLFFFSSNLIAATVFMICAVTGLAFLFPALFRTFASVMRKIAAKHDRAVWELALTESVSRKSTVTSGILCATSASMCIIVFAIAMSAIETFEAKIYTADVVVSVSEDPARYSFIGYIDGVSDVERYYETTDTVKTGGSDEVHEYRFCGVPEGGYKYYSMYRGLPDKVEDGTVYIHRSMIDRSGWKEGDKITITFNCNMFFPIEQEMTVGGIFDTASAIDGKNLFVISQNDYIRIFHDKPSQLLVKADDPEMVAAMINKYTVGDNTARTRTEIEDSDMKEASQAIAVFLVIIGVAVGMTSVGMISNQIIGFEGRRKELAIMLSTAMDQKTLRRVLVREILTMSGFAAGLGAITGALVTIALKHGVAGMEGVSFELNLTPVPAVMFWIIMTLLYTMTVLFPVAKMKKMKISEQIKYE